MVHLPFVAMKLVVLALGGSIATLAFLASRRNRDPFMLLLSVGFAIAAIGSFLEAYLFEFLGWDLFTVHVVESIFLFLGLGIVAVLLRPRFARREAPA